MYSEQYKIIFVNQNVEGYCRKTAISVDGQFHLIARYLNDSFFDLKSFYLEYLLPLKAQKAGDNTPLLEPDYMSVVIDEGNVILTDINDPTSTVTLLLDDFIGIIEEFYAFASQLPLQFHLLE